MASQKITDLEIQKAYIDAGGDKTAAARNVGIARTTYRDRLEKAGIPDLPETKESRFSVSYADNTTIIEWFAEELSPEDAITRAGVDLAIWEIEKIVVNSWEVTMKLRQGQNKHGRALPDKAMKSKNRQAKIVLRRKVPKTIEEASKALIERMQKHSPNYKKSVYPKISDPHLLELSIFDHHFGKLAWHRETENNYDLAIAESIYLEAVKDLAAKVRGFPIEKVLIPIGQDLFHIDSPKNQTYKETPQDVDGRYAKIFECGAAAIINAVDFLRKIAPVELVYSRGNHDPTTGWHLVKYLEAWYRRDEDVVVDAGPKARKYFHYGCVLIGFTHGDEEKQDRLPTIMAAEVPDLWAKSTFREWHTGHFHKRKETRYTATDSHVGVIVRTLPSLSGTDYWHYLKGYINNNRAAEAYLWSKENGYTGHFSSNVRVDIHGIEKS